jgi:hypothetical protein
VLATPSFDMRDDLINKSAEVASIVQPLLHVGLLPTGLQRRLIEELRQDDGHLLQR